MLRFKRGIHTLVKVLRHHLIVKNLKLKIRNLWYKASKNHLTNLKLKSIPKVKISKRLNLKLNKLNKTDKQQVKRKNSWSINLLVIFCKTRSNLSSTTHSRTLLCLHHLLKNLNPCSSNNRKSGFLRLVNQNVS